MRVKDVTDLLESWFPLHLAESWDNVGLLLGDPARPARRVMTCLSISAETASEAIETKADLIVAHHPIFFRPARRLTATSDGTVWSLAAAGISLFSPHTSFDGARGGINEQIAERLGLSDVRPIRPASKEKQYKLVVFVPESDWQAVSRALFDAGAGVIGEYAECSFRLAGTGTFLGSELSNPTIGSRGQREEVNEQRVEVVVPAARLSAALSALVAAHSYEEPAFDIYPLEPLPDRTGAGRLGKLPEAMPLVQVAELVAERLSSPAVEIVGADDAPCEVVGIGCGSAFEMAQDAFGRGADVFLTGEARFHDLLAARDQGWPLIVAGHDATERFATAALAERLGKHLSGVEVWASRQESDPVSKRIARK